MPCRLKTILVILTLSTLSFGETIIDYSPISDETWTLVGSPYRIRVNVTIENLTIEPGVTVLFDNDYKFDINNNLHAVGFFSDSIYFRPDTSNHNGWQGLKFKSGASASSLSYCRIEESNLYGIRTEGSTPSLMNCTIVNSAGDGLQISNNPISIRHCHISNNYFNGILLDASGITASNIIISKNGQNGIYSDNSNDSLNLTNINIVDNQNYGFYFETQNIFIKN
jgi:hypothetical protein